MTDDEARAAFEEQWLKPGAQPCQNKPDARAWYLGGYKAAMEKTAKLQEFVDLFERVRQSLRDEGEIEFCASNDSFESDAPGEVVTVLLWSHPSRLSQEFRADTLVECLQQAEVWIKENLEGGDA